VKYDKVMNRRKYLPTTLFHYNHVYIITILQNIDGCKTVFPQKFSEISVTVYYSVEFAGSLLPGDFFQDRLTLLFTVSDVCLRKYRLSHPL